jgi:hypothetical protein
LRFVVYDDNVIVRCFKVCGCVIAALLGVLPASATAYPYTTTSYYESTTSASTLYNQGCSAGSARAEGLVILDFGRPAYRDGAYGTMLFGSGGFASNVAILNAMEAFADGYWNCSPAGPKMTIARGTSNYCHPGSACSLLPPDYGAAGSYWGIRTNDLATYISNSGYASQETSAAADDAEPAWDPGFASTRHFIAGYNSAAQWLLFDYGSLESGYWSRASEYYVAYTGANFPMPQIYYSSMAASWESLELWAVANRGASMLMIGVTSEWPAAGTLTPHEGYDAMLAQLQSHAGTYQSSIDYLTDI